MPAAPRRRLELRQEEHHEYHRGEVFAMAGGTEPHARLITNLVVRLSAALSGAGWGVSTDALGVRVETEDLFAYPDLSVVCGEAQFFDAYVPVDAAEPAVDVIARDGAPWRLTATRHDGEAVIPPLGVALSLADRYGGVTWDAPDDAPRLHPSRPA